MRDGEADVETCAESTRLVVDCRIACEVALAVLVPSMTLAVTWPARRCGAGGSSEGRASISCRRDSRILSATDLPSISLAVICRSRIARITKKRESAVPARCLVVSRLGGRPVVKRIISCAVGEQGPVVTVARTSVCWFTAMRGLPERRSDSPYRAVTSAPRETQWRRSCGLLQ